jgi:protein-L-isoaspartate(D-aspartate) O-methyltransferase
MRPDRWAPVPPEIDAAVAADAALAEAAHRARFQLTEDVIHRVGTALPVPLLPRYLDSVLRAPRERFVLPEDIALSAHDSPLPLDREGLATVSAPHAYLLSYGLLQLGYGDHLLELGTGTGYGAAIAREIIGPSGRITSIEIDPHLARRARLLLGLLEEGARSQITLFAGDAREIAPTLLQTLAGPHPPIKVAVTFALHSIPALLVDLLPEGARLVAPVAAASEPDAPRPPDRDHDEVQQLVLWERRGGTVQRSVHGAVRYVTERH